MALPLLAPNLLFYRVRACSTANVAMRSGIGGVLDGVTLASGDRVLLRAQSDMSQNGIWIVQAGAWKQSGFPGGNASDRIIVVDEGTQEGTTWTIYGNPVWGTDPFTVDTAPLATASTFAGILGLANGGTGINGSSVTGNRVFASPDGSTGALSMRALVPRDISFPTATAATPGSITGAGFVLYRKTDNNVELFDGTEAKAKLVQGLSVAAPSGSTVSFAPTGTFVPMAGLSNGVLYKAKEDGTIVSDATVITGPFTLYVGVAETQGGVLGLRVQLGPVTAV